jgi:hypothetical protein
MLRWEGNIAMTDQAGNIDPNNNYILRKIITDREYFDVIGKSGLSPLGAMITTKFEEEKENLLDSDEFGGPLLGRIFGNNHKSITDLLSESSNIHLRQEQEYINDINCYVLEGTTKYGKVTVWIAPAKGYIALKWKIEKTGENFGNESPILNNGLILWSAQFECEEIQRIGASFVPKIATFVFTSKSKDGSNHSKHIVYTISDIQLNPDFNALGAFKIDLPEGTRVTVPESPIIRHIWRDGKVVPDMNGATLEEIDKTINQFKQQQ